MCGLWIWVMIHSIRELSAALMLQSHRSLVLSTLLWHIWERGEIPRVAVLGVGLVVFLLFIMVLGQLLSRRFELLIGKR
jgi:iron(III) transport system permease protein